MYGWGHGIPLHDVNKDNVGRARIHLSCDDMTQNDVTFDRENIKWQDIV